MDNVSALNTFLFMSQIFASFYNITPVHFHLRKLSYTSDLRVTCILTRGTVLSHSRGDQYGIYDTASKYKSVERPLQVSLIMSREHPRFFAIGFYAMTFLIVSYPPGIVDMQSNKSATRSLNKKVVSLEFPRFRHIALGCGDVFSALVNDKVCT
jgi:hypothetical protein